MMIVFEWAILLCTFLSRLFSFFVFFANFSIAAFLATFSHVSVQWSLFVIFTKWTRILLRFGHLTGSFQFFCEKKTAKNKKINFQINFLAMQTIIRIHARAFVSERQLISIKNTIHWNKEKYKIENQFKGSTIILCTDINWMKWKIFDLIIHFFLLRHSYHCLSFGRSADRNEWCNWRNSKTKFEMKKERKKRWKCLKFPFRLQLLSTQNII